MINVCWQWQDVGSGSDEFIEKSNCSRKNCLNFYKDDLGSELCAVRQPSCEITSQRIITTLLVLRDRLFVQVWYLTVCGFRNQAVGCLDAK